MRKTMSEKQLDFCLDVYEQVQEVLFLRTPFAEDREVIFQLNQRTRSFGWCYLYDSWTARIEISEYAYYKTKRAWVVKDLLAHGGSRVYKLTTGENMRAKLIVRD